jgi:NAD(P)-dependent dehydrogenase (short-subunit alcohol dehydrogenase family)
MENLMKIVVVGATGTIGKAVVKELSGRHETISVGKTHGQHQVDIADSKSLRTLFETLGKIDAIVSATGNLHFGPLSDMTAEQFRVGLESKLLGQVDLALIGQHYLNDGGSITLTGGILSEEPIRYGANATTVNLALEGFVRAASVELPRGLRINVVSPTIVQESLERFGAYMPGFEAVPAFRVALAYVRSIEGIQTGKVYRVF